MLNSAVPVFGTYDGCWHESDHKVVPTLTIVPDRAVVPRKVETFKTNEECWADEKANAAYTVIKGSALPDHAVIHKSDDGTMDYLHTPTN
jgi:hypothetical protein